MYTSDIKVYKNINFYKEGSMKLSDWAKKNGLNYQTAYRWYKAGKLPASAYQADTGTIIITEENNLNQKEDEMKFTNSAMKRDLENLYNLISYNPFNESPLYNINSRESQKFKWFNKPDKYVLGCILPGYSENDVKISVKGDILSILAKVENADEDNLFFQGTTQEFSYSWTLPSDASYSEISADFKNGILYLTVPKVSAKQKEEIQISINKK